MPDNEIRVVISGVAADLRKALDGAKGDLGGLSTAIREVPNQIKINVDAQTAAAQERLAVLKAEAAGVKEEIKISADADTGVAQAKLALLERGIRNTETEIAKAKLGLTDLSAAIKDVPDQVKVSVRADTLATLGRLRELRDMAKDVPTDIRVKAEADTSLAAVKLRLLQQQARDTEEALARAELGGLLTGGGGGGGGFGSSLLSGLGSGGLPGAAPLGVGAVAAPLVAGAAGSVTAIAGSAGAGILGAGALATSLAGILGTGLGAMLPVLAQTKTGVSAVSSAMDALEKAQADYGKSSLQAKQAQANLNGVIADAGPLAAGIAQQLSAISDQWDQMSKPAQKALGQIITPALNAVKDLLPTIAGIAKTSFEAIGKALDPVFKGLSSPAFKQVLTELGDDFAKLAGPLIAAGANLMRAFFSVAVAAAPYVIQIAQAFERWTASFAKSLAPGAQLQGLIAYLVSQLHSWFDLAKAIGELMITVFRSGAREGQGLVDKLTGIVEKWDAWLNTPAGQAAMTKFFTDSGRLLGAVLKTLEPVVKLIASMSVGLIPTMTTLLAPIASLLATISQWINGLSKDLPPVLNALPGLAVAVGVLAGWKALQALVSATATSILSVAKSKLPGGAAAGAEGGAAVAGAEGAGAGAAAGGGASLLGIVAIPVAITAGLVALSKAIHGDGGLNADLKTMQTNLKAAIAAGDVAKIRTLSDTIGAFGKKIADVGGHGADQFLALANAGNQAAGRIEKSFGTLSTKLTEVGPLFKIMAGDAGLSLKTIQTQAASAASAIASTLGTKSTAARVAIATNFKIAADDVRASMQAGVINTGQGMKAISDMLAKALKALGGKPLAVSDFLADIGPGVVTEANLVAAGDISPGAANSPHATGGLVQIGQAGQRGRDTIPLNVGGAHIRVGAGEKAAIFNAEQQAVADHFMAPVGGLAGMFRKFNRPHYMAGGGFTVGASEFGGPGDPTTPGSSGAYGADVTGSIARLQSGGPYFSQLAPGSRWTLTAPTGKSVIATVTDLGAGGGSVSGHPRAIDLWWQTANALGLPGSAGNWTGLLNVTPAGVAGGIPGAGAGAIATPSVKGGGVVSDVVRGALKSATAAANATLARASLQGTVTGAGGPLFTGVTPAGLSTFEGVQMSTWIADELRWGVAHGWHGQPTSGYRPGFDPHAPSGSEHALINYPGGAVDFGGFTDPNAYATKLALVNLAARLNYPGPRLKMPIGFHDDGHLSGTGHATGGFVPGFAGGGAPGSLFTPAVAHRAATRPHAPAHVTHSATPKIHVPGAISDSLKRLLPSDVVGLDASAAGYAARQVSLSDADAQLTLTQGLAPYPAQPLVTISDADAAVLDPTDTAKLHALSDQLVSTTDPVTAAGIQSQIDTLTSSAMPEAGDELVNPSGMTVGRYFGPGGRILGGSFVPGISQRQVQISHQLTNLYGQRDAITHAGRFYDRAAKRELAARRQRDERRARVLAFLRAQVVKAKAIQAELAAITTGNLKANVAKALSKQAVARRLSDLRAHKQTVASELAAERHSQSLLIPLEKDPTHTNALSAQLDQINQSIGVETQLSTGGAASVAVAAAKSAVLRHSLTDRLKAYAKVDTELGGKAYDVGTGGLLGQLQSQADALDQNRSTDLANKVALAPAMTEIKNAIAAYLTERQGLGSVAAVQVRTPLAPAAAPAAAGPDLAALNALLAQQLASTQQTLSLSQSQFATLQGFAPLVSGRLVGSFQSGIDFVPQTGPALVHKGEMILPDPSGPAGNRAAASIHTASGVPEIVVVLGNDETPLMKIVSATMNQRALKIVSEHSGQRARLMAGVRRP